jgi:hypothetical protein
MIHKLTHIKDKLGNNYMGIKYNESLIEEFLMQLLDHVGVDKFDVLTDNQQRRDRESYHTTVINVMEYNRLRKNLKDFDKVINESFQYHQYSMRMIHL